MPDLIPPPLSLYMHFPWCVRKCPYCDFNSHTLQTDLPEDRYVEALERDMAAQAEGVRGRPLISVFMGGGTPSLFPPRAIARVIEAVCRHFAVSESIEITMEANPGTIERGRFAEYAAAGINRVSLGGQSFDARALQALGRIHSADDTVTAAEELHHAGLSNFNIDLMYGLPRQSVQGAVNDLERALELHPAHLSHYQLTLEPGTVFAAAPPTLPDDDSTVDMLAQCTILLDAAGFKRYEVSAYARAGMRCAHNLNYWTFGDYVGVGAGAHGKLTSEDGIARTVHLREPRRYLASDPCTLELKPVPQAELPFEFMLNGLRLLEGFDARLFEQRTGLPWSSILPTLRTLAERGLVELEGERCRPGTRGLEFLNESLVEFLPEKPLPSRFAALSTG